MPATPADIPDRAMTDLANILIALDLQGAVDGQGNTIVGNIGSRVYTALTLDNSNVLYPNILITNDGEEEEDDDEASNFEQDGVIWPYRILIQDRQSERYRDADPTYRLWRWTIGQVLLGLPTQPNFLPNTPEAFDIRVRRLKIFEPKPPQYQFVVSGLVAGVRTVTPRWRGGVKPT